MTLLAGAALLAEHRPPAWEDFDALTWSLVGISAVAAIWVVWKAVHYTMHPGEAEPDHIKRSILDEPEQQAVEGLEVTLSSGDAGAGAARHGPASADGA